MRIHSSSLTPTPASLNRTAGRNDIEQNNNRPIPSNTPDTQSNRQPSSPEEIKQTLEKIGSELETSGQNQPTHKKAIQALSAYTREFNAPIQEQRNQLIAGIDTYA